MILKMEEKENFSKNLENQINIPKEVAQKIALEIDRSIFSQVKKSPEKIHSLEETVGVKIKTPDLSMEVEEPSLIKSLPKKEPSLDPPIPPTPTITPAPQPTTPRDMPAGIRTPVTPPISPKPIVGAEKMGVGIPEPESPKEHLFEKKLREAVQPPTPPKQTAESSVTAEPPVSQKKVDPYREIAE